MGKLTIGWIGAGIMGAPMCTHIIDAGYKVCVYEYSLEKAKAMEAYGAEICTSPMEVAEKSDVICSMVGSPADVKEIMFGEAGVFLSIRKGSMIIDFTSSDPSLAKDIARKAHVIGVDALDAPVTGGESGAKNKTLSIMVGGTLEAYERASVLLDILSPSHQYMGGPGAGQHTKIAGQILGASTILGVVESLMYSGKADLDLAQVVSVLEKGSVGSWLYTNLGPKIVEGDFSPGFAIKHFIKDMGIALDESKRQELFLPGLALVQQLYIAATALGQKDQGIQGLYSTFQHINNSQKTDV